MSVLLFDNPVSGNCHKVRLILGLRGIEFERRQMSVVDYSERIEVLGGLSPTLNLPTVVLEDGRPLAESNAILWYFADGSEYVPDDPYERAQVLQWMFFEQYKHEPGIAVPRFWDAVAPESFPRPADLDLRKASGREALKVMERHLRQRQYFVGERFTIADITLYAYTHVAPEAGFDLEALPALRAWLERVEGQPGIAPMEPLGKNPGA
ncbi:MAG TPA: glutathione S-transferase family protein [Solirubrobacterales bacterium]|nr:glutathione S-transferase family protein [Solirubrobacterales bacterium]